MKNNNAEKPAKKTPAKKTAGAKKSGVSPTAKKSFKKSDDEEDEFAEFAIDDELRDEFKTGTGYDDEDEDF